MMRQGKESGPADGPAAAACRTAASGRKPRGLRRLSLRWRMTLYAAVFLGLVLGALPWIFYRLDVCLPAAHVEIGPWRWAGVALFAVAFAIYAVGSVVLVFRGKGAYVEFDPPRELVICGPYRYVRNPVAGTLVLSMVGLALAFSSTGILLMAGIFAVLTHLQVTRIEEPLLRRRYGPAYDDYCAAVPRWLPALRAARYEAPTAAPADRQGRQGSDQCDHA